MVFQLVSTPNGGTRLVAPIKVEPKEEITEEEVRGLLIIWDKIDCQIVLNTITCT